MPMPEEGKVPVASDKDTNHHYMNKEDPYQNNDDKKSMTAT